MYYKLGRAGKALDRFGVDRVRDHDRPGRPRRAADRQGLRGDEAQHPQQGRDPVRRRRARRAADRPDRGVPRRQRASSAGLAQMGPIKSQADSVTRLFRSPRTAVPPGDGARGDAGPGDHRRHRRAARARLPVGGVVVDMVRPRDLDDDDLAAVRAGKVDQEAGRRRAEPRPGSTGDRRPGRRSAQRGARPRRAAGAGGRASAQLVAKLGVPTYELPRLAGGIDLGALYELAGAPARPGNGMRTSMARRRREHRTRGRTARRPRSRRPDPRHRRACSTTRRPGSSCAAARGGVGKTTTSAALALRARRAGPEGRRTHHRPGPPARPVDGDRGARQHPAPGAGVGGTAAGSTR